MVMQPEHTNAWWLQDPNEDIWLESTDRRDLGRNLLAPISNHAGQKLVAFVQPGDLILHYYQPTRQIVAYSLAESAPFVSVIRWPDRELSPEEPAYEVTLGHFTFFSAPLSLADVREREAEIRVIRQELGILADEGSVYFPFQVPELKQISPSQGAYLTKMPRAVFDLFPELDEARDLQERAPSLPGQARVRPTSPTPRAPSTRKSVTGRQQDVRKKLAAELYAMDRATEYLRGLGYEVQDVSNQPSLGYDLFGSQGVDEVGCEAKGSLNDRIAIDLQASEVDFAREVRRPVRSLLYVVDQVVLEFDGTEFKGVSGREGLPRPLVTSYLHGVPVLRGCPYAKKVPEGVQA